MNCGSAASSVSPMKGIGATLNPLQQDLRQNRDERQIDGAGQREPRQNRVDVLRGPLARPDAGNEPAVLPHVLGDVVRIEDDRRVEVREEDDARPRTAGSAAACRCRAAPAPTTPTDSGTPARSSDGNARIDEAKITGITPPVFTLSGMCVLDPPYIRRPTTRLAYWTVSAPVPALDEDDAGNDQHHHERSGRRPTAGPSCPVRI